MILSNERLQRRQAALFRPLELPNRDYVNYAIFLGDVNHLSGFDIHHGPDFAGYGDSTLRGHGCGCDLGDVWRSLVPFLSIFESWKGGLEFPVLPFIILVERLDSASISPKGFGQNSSLSVLDGPPQNLLCPDCLHPRPAQVPMTGYGVVSCLLRRVIKN